MTDDDAWLTFNLPEGATVQWQPRTGRVKSWCSPLGLKDTRVIAGAAAFSQEQAIRIGLDHLLQQMDRRIGYRHTVWLPPDLLERLRMAWEQAMRVVPVQVEDVTRRAISAGEGKPL